MRKSILALSAAMLASLATPAFAQDEEAPAEDTSGITITGGATVVSDYRFRGFSQSNEEFAIQGTFTVAHDSGFYIGTWGSSIGFAGGTEIDAYAGWSKEVSPGVTFDIGGTYYIYPNGVGDTDLIEAYTSVKGAIGPATAKVGVAYAPEQSAIGDFSSVYVWTDIGVGVPNTPISLSGHLGYAVSDSFLGGVDGETLDYSFGASVTYKALTLGVSYVNTDVPNPFKEGLGADGAVVFSLGAAF